MRLQPSDEDAVCTGSVSGCMQCEAPAMGDVQCAEYHNWDYESISSLIKGTLCVGFFVAL